MISTPSLQKIEKTLDKALGLNVRRVSKRKPSPKFGYMLPGHPPLQHETVIVEEHVEQWSKLAGILFCVPFSQIGKEEILPNLDYFHHRSGFFVDFFCIGYDTQQPVNTEVLMPTTVSVVNKAQWQFNAKSFNNGRSCIESLTNWKFSGETDLILTVARKPKDGMVFLDYSSAISCNLEKMLRDQAITSVRAFFEKIFEFGHKYSGVDPVLNLSDKFGIYGAHTLLEEVVLSLLPEAVRKQYKSTKHFAISNIAR